MATIAIQPMRPYKTISGGPPFRMKMVEHASQTFKVGAILVQDQSTGKLKEAAADPDRIFGIAEEDGHDVASPGNSDNVAFALATGDTVFVGNLFTAQTTAYTDIGGSYGVTKVGNNWTVDKTKVTTSRRVRIIDLDRRDAVGDIQGRVLFQFVDNFTATAFTS